MSCTSPAGALRAPLSPLQTLALLVRDIIAPALLLSLAIALALAAAVAAVLVLLAAAASPAVAAGEPDLLPLEGTLGLLEGVPAAAMLEDGTSALPASSVAPMGLALTRATLQVRVAGCVADAIVEQEFVNDSASVLETRYLFPLPENSVVHFLELETEGRLLEGVATEKVQAQREFAAARVEGRRASLLEQHRPNAFTTRVTNVLPGSSVIVRLGFAFVVPFDDGLYRLRLPLTVAGRYEPGRRGSGARQKPGGDDTVPAAPAATEAELATRSIAVEVSLASGLPVRRLHSPSHEIRAEGGGFTTQVVLAREDERPDRDFVLEYALGEGPEPGADVHVSPEADGWREVLVLLSPPEQPRAAAPRSKEVLFVVDTSGSMDGGSLEAAKSALVWCLDHLQPGDRFGITEYDSQFTRLSDEPQDADAPSIETARAWVRGLLADGGTELLPALEATLGQEASASHHRMVIVLTDGHVGNEPEVLDLLERKLGRARLFVLGIGSAPNAGLVSKMAALGRGVSGFLAPGEAVEAGVARLFARVSLPLLWDLDLTVRGADVDSIYPERMGDLYAGLPVAVFARVRATSPFEVEVMGEGAEGAWAFTRIVDPSAAPEESTVVGLLWARARIEMLEESHAHAAGGFDGRRVDILERAEIEDLRQELIGHAVQWSIASSQTSFVVVDRHVVAPGGPSSGSDIALATPAEWPATASSRPRALAAGLALLGFGIFRLLLGWLELKGLRRG